MVSKSDIENLAGNIGLAIKALIPNKTSDLTNDGDGTSNFVTNDELWGTFTELQTLINNASLNDIINLKRDYINNNNSSTITFNEKNLIINGNGHIIDGNNITQILKIYNNSNITINDCIIKNGYVTNVNGGGISLPSDANSKLILNNCTISNNNINGNYPGGGIYIGNTCVLIANDCIFDNNNAGTNNGGAIFCDTGSNVNINNSTFSNNKASSGGAIQGGTSIDCVFNNNIANLGMGGGAIRSGSAINCIFNGNTAPNRTISGAIRDGIITNCEFLTDSDTVDTDGININNLNHKWRQIKATGSTISKPFFRLYNVKTNNSNYQSPHFIFEITNQREYTSSTAKLNRNVYAKIRVTLRQNDAENNYTYFIDPIFVKDFNLDKLHFGIHTDWTDNNQFTLIDVFYEMSSGQHLITRIYEDKTREGKITSYNPVENTTEVYTSLIEAGNTLYNTTYNKTIDGLTYEGTFTDLKNIINSSNDGDIILLDKDYKNSGAEEDLSITKEIIIDGQGHIIDCNNVGRFIYTGDVDKKLVLQNMTIKNGAGNYGGAIGTQMHLTLINCTFINNKSTNTVSASTSSSDGGAIYVVKNRKVNIIDCVFNNNKANNRGGAIGLNNGELTIINSEFIKNKSLGIVPNGVQSGGAIRTNQNTTLNVINSIFDGNTAIKTGETNNGGAIYNNGTATAINCSWVTDTDTTINVTNYNYITTESRATQNPLISLGRSGIVGSSTKLARENHQHPMFVAHADPDTTNTGYLKVLKITYVSWCDRPLYILFGGRGGGGICKIRFTNVNASTTTASVSQSYLYGDNKPVYIYNNQDNTFDVIIKNSGTHYDVPIRVIDPNNLTIEHINESMSENTFNALTQANLTKIQTNQWENVWSQNGGTIRTDGKLVELIISKTGVSLTANTNTELFTIPSKYKPLQNCFTLIHPNITDAFLYIDKDGKVNVRSETNKTNQNIYTSILYKLATSLY